MICIHLFAKGITTEMGMSASQARLLSITTRLTNNEFRSQMTANSKIRLANETQIASEKYMKALDSSKLQYSYFDANGNKTQQTLTAGVLSYYQPLKNQYALVNNAGQVLVSSADATTFTEATNRDEFLVLNKCAETVKKDIDNPAYPQWKREVPDINDSKYYDETSSTDSELYKKFVQAGSSCYTSAMGGGAGCYLHVLAHILDYVHDPVGFQSGWQHVYTKQEAYPKTYETSVPGMNVNIDIGQISGAGMHNQGNSEMISEVSDAVCNGYKGETIMAVNPDDYNAKRDPADPEYYTFTTGNPDADALLSSKDANGNLKTLKQKSIDLFYVVENYRSLGLDYETLKNALKNYQVDMSVAFKELEFNKERYDGDYEAWEKKEPPKTIQVDDIEITDPDKAEWYTNLWHRMNGALDAESVMGESNDPSTNSRPVEGEYYYKSKPEDLSYAVLEDSLMNSPEWLQYALEAGVVTLEQVKFQETTDTTNGLEYHEWTAIAWSSTTDISEVDDDLAVTKAEVEYNKTLAQIQFDDKQLDNDIKKLDTEHNALQTEYDSIKGVMEKNMERSFKAFS